MRTAWDFAGSALGSRIELYEMFYLTSQGARIGDHMYAQRDGEWNQVQEFCRSPALPGCRASGCHKRAGQMSGSHKRRGDRGAGRDFRAAMRLLASEVALVTTLDGAVCLAALR
jgi:hypothetical protein